MEKIFGVDSVATSLGMQIPTGAFLDDGAPVTAYEFPNCRPSLRQPRRSMGEDQG